MAVIKKPPTGTSSLKKRSLQPPEPVTMTGEEFYSVTEFNERYVRHNVPPRFQPPRAEYHPNEAKLDALTNQKNDYRPWPVSAPVRHQYGKYEPKEGSFYAESTSQADYNPKPLPPPQRRLQQYVNSGANMGFATGSNFDAGAGQSNNYTGGFTLSDGSVVPTDTYRGGYIPNNVKLDTVTSQRGDYKAWPTSLPERRQQAKYVPSESKFDGSTTTRSDYSAKELPPHYRRAPPAYQNNNNMMETLTTHKESFVPWKMEGAGPQKYRNIQTPKKGAASVLNIGNH